MKNKVGIYAASFDPITIGHLDIIVRSSKIVDKLIVSVADNINKKYLFNKDERLKMVNKEIQNLKSLISKKLKLGLLMDY